MVLSFVLGSSTHLHSIFSNNLLGKESARFNEIIFANEAVRIHQVRGLKLACFQMGSLDEKPQVEHFSFTSL
jgi:hypothetical protein